VSDRPTEEEVRDEQPDLSRLHARPDWVWVHGMPMRHPTAGGRSWVEVGIDGVPRRGLLTIPPAERDAWVLDWEHPAFPAAIVETLRRMAAQRREDFDLSCPGPGSAWVRIGTVSASADDIPTAAGIVLQSLQHYEGNSGK